MAGQGSSTPDVALVRPFLWGVGARQGMAAFGGQDLAGNVYEWMSDWYVSPYDETQSDNPLGAASANSRAVRGGGWGTSDADSFRASTRFDTTPSDQYGDLGFRCARTPN